MAEIYTCATGVLAWLGQQKEIEKKGTQLIHHLNDIFHGQLPQQSKLSMPDPMRDALNVADLPHSDILGLPSMEENGWPGLMNIL